MSGDFRKRIYPGRFVVPPSGGVTPPEGGTANLSLVYSLLEIASVVRRYGQLATDN
ncbi:hypothetical protein QUF80_01715 [Desulfococcaceae bacterium HSG8]|nr:hypothetical protein [Desulfococcaceae bacterium HSG8]